MSIISSSSPGSAVAAWDNDYARVARVASQMRTRGLHQRSSPLTPSSATSGGIGGGDDRQQQLNAHVARLESALGTLPLPVAELQRRRRLVQHLRGNNNNNNNNSGYTPPTTNTASQLQQHMAEQDAMIDDLAAGVSRMRDQTQVIHDEARLHVNMLGDMEENLGAAQSGLDVETKRAAKLKEDKSVWRLQLIIAGEAVLCLLLLLTGLS